MSSNSFMNTKNIGSQLSKLNATTILTVIDMFIEEYKVLTKKGPLAHEGVVSKLHFANDDVDKDWTLYNDGNALMLLSSDGKQQLKKEFNYE